MKGIIIGLVLGIVLSIIGLFLIGSILLYQENITGNAVNVPTNDLTYSSDKPIEQTILDEKQILKENMHYLQSFEVYTITKVNINLTSNELVGYALLPDYEFEHYKNGESYKSYANFEELLFIRDSYNLDEGKYSVVVTSKDKPAEIHLIIKAVEIQ